jgi:hypothetical protein
MNGCASGTRMLGSDVVCPILHPTFCEPANPSISSVTSALGSQTVRYFTPSATVESTRELRERKSPNELKLCRKRANAT